MFKNMLNKHPLVWFGIVTTIITLLLAAFCWFTDYKPYWTALVAGPIAYVLVLGIYASIGGFNKNKDES